MYWMKPLKTLGFLLNPPISAGPGDLAYRLLDLNTFVQCVDQSAFCRSFMMMMAMMMTLKEVHLV